MVSDAKTSRCPQCGAALEADLPGKCCTRCALEQALNAGAEEAGSQALFLGDIPIPGGKLSKIGGYELLEVIAYGGMGVVYKAREDRLNRIVALKLLLGGAHARPDFKRRFQHEAETAAQLQHPNIVPIYAVGEHEGQPYFSMEYVEGPDLAKRLGEGPLSTKESAEFLRLVAEAVAYAHQRGVLHRDLKPSNILVGLDDRPRVTDFGLARHTGADSGLTLSGAVMGTPGYMAPEQAQGRTREITTAADVWSLGVILYLMLTGEAPFAGQTPLETAKQVVETDPPRPSSLKRGVDRDLETICLKCLEKDPKRRYETAKGLAEDLERWQKHEPIQARPVSPLKRVLKWVLSRPAAAIVITLSILILVGATAFASNLVMLRKARYNEAVRHAEVLLHQGETRAASGRMREAKERTLESRQLSLSLNTSPLPADLSLLEIFRSSPPPLLTLTGHQGKVTCVAASGPARRIISGGEDGFLRVWSLPMGRQEAAWLAHTGGVSCLALAPDARSCISAGTNGEINLWNVLKATLERHLQGHRATVSALCFSPNGDAFASASGDRSLRLWNFPSGELEREIPTPEDHILAIAFSPDGRDIASGTAENGLAIWSLEDLTNPTRLDPDRPVQAVAYSPDGTHILSGDSRGGLLFRGAHERGTPKGWLTGPAITSISFFSAGTEAVSAANDGTISTWRLFAVGTEPVVKLSEHGGAVNGLATLGDHLAVSASDDGTVRVWNANSDRDVPEFLGHDFHVSRAVFSTDGNLILSAGWDGKVKLWDAPTGKRMCACGEHSGAVFDATFSPDDRRVLSAGEDGTIRLWDVLGGAEVRRFRVTTNAVRCAAFSRDGNLIVAGEGPNATTEGAAPNPGSTLPCAIHVFDAAGKNELCGFPAHNGGVFALAFSPNGRSLLTGGGDGKMRLWEVGTWREVRSFDADKRRVNSVAFAPDGNTCVSAGDSGSLTLWDLSSGRLLRSSPDLKANVLSAAVSPDGKLLLAGTRSGEIRLWDMLTGREVHEFSWNTSTIFGVAFAPDGRAAISAESGSTIRLWDFDRITKYMSLSPAAQVAKATLQHDPHDGSALRTLADWYQFRGIWNWAAELYEQARTNGAAAPRLSLARCHWLSAHPQPALNEFAAAARQNEAPAFYLQLCRQTVEQEAAAGQVSASKVAPRAGQLVLQPGPSDGNDIWTESVYSHAQDSAIPGGGLNDYRLRVGGWGDTNLSLLQFDLTGAPTNAASAALWLFCFVIRGDASPMYLDRITRDWDWKHKGTGRDHDRLWYADRPSTSPWRADPLPPPNSNQWYQIDITDLYNAWQSGAYPNHGLQLRPAPHLNLRINEFYSADFLDDPTLRPKLVITPKQ